MESEPNSTEPLHRKELTGSKRRAEILSKESGKIGVTISTRSPNRRSNETPSPSPPPSRMPRLIPVSKANKSSTYVTVNGHQKVSGSSITDSAISLSKRQTSNSLKNQSDISTSNNLKSSKLTRKFSGGSGAGSTSNSSHRPDDNSQNNGYCSDDNFNDQQSDAEDRILLPESKFWLLKNPIVNQIVITDVTVNSKRVTIRECKTEEGFFRDRSKNDPV